MKTRLKVIYEDESVIALDKPAGLATVRERDGTDGLSDLLGLRLQEKVFIIHRLDKETTGIVLFARNEDAHTKLSLQFQKREVTKTYLALVEGAIPESEGTIDYPLAPDPKNRFKMRIDEKRGKECLTSFSVEKRFLKYTLLKAMPKTGRTHQLRLHFAGFGHPVACDGLYGNGNPLYLSRIKKNYRRRKDRPEKPLLARLALHAWKLEFHHPRTRERMILEAALPGDLRSTLRQLEKYGR